VLIFRLILLSKLNVLAQAFVILILHSCFKTAQAAFSSMNFADILTDILTLFYWLLHVVLLIEITVCIRFQRFLKLSTLKGKLANFASCTFIYISYLFKTHTCCLSRSI